MTQIQLRGGFTTSDPRLDRLPEFDEKSRRFNISRAVWTETTKPPKSWTHRVGLYLDQGQEGACVGFSRAHANAARPIVVPNMSDAEAQRIYKRAQQLDEWPGESYSGSSVLGGVKAAVEFGQVKSYLWAFTLDEFMYGMRKYPAVVGLNWYEGMFNTNDRGYIEPTGDLSGGHAILIHSIKIVLDKYGRVDLDASYVVFWNSWGPTWGVNGTAKMTLRNFDRLRREQGEVCFATDMRIAA